MTPDDPSSRPVHSGTQEPAGASSLVLATVPALVLIVIALVFVVALWGQSLETRMFPHLMAVLLIVVSLAMLVSALRQGWSRPRSQRHGTAISSAERLAKPSAAAILLVLAIAYVAAMGWIGFYGATLAFVAASSLSLGLRKPAVAVVAATTTAGAWLLFDQAFSVPLP